MKKVVATGKTSLSNNTEMHVGPTPPLYPVEGQLWLNTSTQPPVLYKWDGEKWALQEMDVEKLDPEFVEEIQADFDAISKEIQEINEAAEQLKADVEARNKQDDQYFSDMRQTIINNRYEALGWYEENDGRISGIAQSVDGITTRVGKAETNISTLTQTASGLQSTVTSIANGTHSVITQMSDRINLRVEKGKLVSQINASAEGLYLAGKLIYLDGTVKVDGTFVAPRIISTNSDNTAYTKIEGQQLTCYGYFSNNWRGITYAGYHSLEAKVGYLKLKQLTGGNTNALYYSAKGISTRMDADNNGTASGVIEFFAPGYSTMNNSLALASSGNIILESTSGSNIFLNPLGAKVSVSDIMGNRYKLECGNFDCYNISAMDIDCGSLTPYKVTTPSWAIGETNINSLNGKIKIGDSGNINITGTLSQGSRREIKKNIKSFEKSGLGIINSASICEFNYLDDVDGIDMPRIGLIVDEAPVEVVDISNGGYGVLAFDGIWLSWKAIQELDARIKKLEGVAS